MIWSKMAEDNEGCQRATDTKDDDVEAHQSRHRTGRTEEKIWFPGRVFFTFASSVFLNNFRDLRKNPNHRLESADFWDILDEDEVENLTLKFEKEFSKTSQLKWSLFWVVHREMLLAGFLRLFLSAALVSNPILILQLLTSLQQKVPPPDYSKAYGWAVGLGAVMFAKSLFENASLWLTSRAGWKMRAIVCSAVYRKSLRLSNASRQSRTLGEIVNYMQLDAYKIGICTDQIHALWDAPVQVAAFTVVLWFILGWPTFVGLAVTLVSIPLMLFAVMNLAILDRKTMLTSDERVKSTNEAIQSMLGVKVSAWEEALLGVVEKVRGKEVAFLKRGVMMRAIMAGLMGSSPAFASASALTAYVLAANGVANPATLFSALQAFSFLRSPLMLLPIAGAQTAQALVSAKRVDGFLKLDEIENADRTKFVSKSGGVDRDAIERLLASVSSEIDEAIKPPMATASSASRLGGAREGSELIESDAIESSMSTPVKTETSVAEALKKTEYVVVIDKASFAWSRTLVVKPADEKPKNRKGRLRRGHDVTRIRPPPSTHLLGPVYSLTAHIEFNRHRSSLSSGSKPSLATTTAADSSSIALEDCNQTDKPSPLPLVLKDITLKIKKGELVAIVGRVGSGKSALLNAILGEIHMLTGSLFVSSSVCAYASQSPWILNASVRDNILFGAPFEEDKYGRVLQVCQLERDLELFPDGDNTEIGERGVSLSGGQRQRIATARATYWADRSNGFVIFDDILSALDPEVGARLFSECIIGELKDTTRIIVTNQLEYLDRFDRVLVIDNNTIEDQGTLEELMARDNAYGQVLMRFGGSSSIKPASTEAIVPQTNVKKPVTLARNRQGSILMRAEEREIGAVKFSVYMNFIRAGGGILAALFVLFWFMALQVAFFINTIWVTWWTSDAVHRYPNPGRTQTYYIVGMWFTAVLLLLCSCLRTVAIYVFGIRATTNMQRSAFISVLHAKMEFFETTPTGRILQRFSRDVRELDVDLPENLQMFLFTFLFVVQIIITICVITPIFIAFIIPFLCALAGFLYIYRPVMRDAKRLGSIALSPVYAQFSETLNGLATIRAFGAVERFIMKESGFINEATKLSLYAPKLCERWIGLRVDIFSAAVVLVACSLAVQACQAGRMTAGVAGLSIVYATLLSNMAAILVRSFATVEASMNSVERVTHFAKNISQEKWRDSDYKDDPAFIKEVDGDNSTDPDNNPWPSKGALRVENLSMRYRSETPLVIQNLTFDVGPREKIGIVGRSGSGKSSLFVAILRIAEPEPGSRVMLDGLDLKHVRLDKFRSRIGVAPQFPVLFAGTVRYNVDPFEKFSDANIWEALERVGMKSSIATLDRRVAESGENFSQGERQLLSLSRLLLRRPRFVLLDEATASLDAENDEKVQHSIRECFKDSTMLVIAHRLRTIIMSDRILVLAPGGTLAEFDKPQVLLNDPRSQLSLAVAEMGEKQAQMLRTESQSLRDMV